MSDVNAYLSDLRSAVITLSPDVVKKAATAAIDAMKEHRRSIPWDEEWGMHDPRRADAAKAAAAPMDAFLRIIHSTLVEATEPGKQAVASECAELLMDQLYEFATNLCRYTEHHEWDSADHCDDEDIFTKVPPGPAELSLKCYCTQMAIWHGWCYRGSHMFCEVAEVKPGESPIRKVEQMILLLTSSCKMTGTDPTWQDLVKESMWQNETDLDNPFEGTLQNFDEFIVQLSMHSEDYTPVPVMKGLFDALYPVREWAIDKYARGEMSYDEMDEHTLDVAYAYLKKVKRGFYGGLWRKWWLTWTTVSRMSKVVGESQGAIDGPIGQRALVEFDADMGDSAGSDFSQEPANAKDKLFVAVSQGRADAVKRLGGSIDSTLKLSVRLLKHATQQGRADAVERLYGSIGSTLKLSVRLLKHATQQNPPNAQIITHLATSCVLGFKATSNTQGLQVVLNKVLKSLAGRGYIEPLQLTLDLMNREHVVIYLRGCVTEAVSNGHPEVTSLLFSLLITPLPSQATRATPGRPRQFRQSGHRLAKHGLKCAVAHGQLSTLQLLVPPNPLITPPNLAICSLFNFDWHMWIGCIREAAARGQWEIIQYFTGSSLSDADRLFKDNAPRRVSNGFTFYDHILSASIFGRRTDYVRWILKNHMDKISEELLKQKVKTSAYFSRWLRGFRGLQTFKKAVRAWLIVSYWTKQVGETQYAPTAQGGKRYIAELERFGGQVPTLVVVDKGKRPRVSKCHTTVSRMSKAVGESQGAIDGPIGQRALVEFDAESQ